MTGGKVFHESFEDAELKIGGPDVQVTDNDCVHIGFARIPITVTLNAVSEQTPIITHIEPLSRIGDIIRLGRWPWPM